MSEQIIAQEEIGKSVEETTAGEGKFVQFIGSTVIGFVIYFGYVKMMGRDFGQTELLVTLAVTVFNAITMLCRGSKEKNKAEVKG